MLNPQGKVVKPGSKHLSLEKVADVRIGKHIRLQLEAEDEAAAAQKVEKACKKLLANMILESFSDRITAN